MTSPSKHPPRIGGIVRTLAASGLVALLGVGCKDPETRPECLTEMEAFTGYAKTLILSIPEEDGVGPITAQIVVPWEAPRYEDGVPVVVFVHGTWGSDHVPLGTNSSRMTTGHGTATVYFNLPGGSTDLATPGENDRRGPVARAVLAQVLRYAAGDVPDMEGCTLGERVPDGVTGEVVMASFSNGGNLAWATLADESLELPEVVGVASFETPANGQMATAEPGTEVRESPLYEEGACRLDADGALSCDFAYTPLGWDASLSPATDGVLWLDDGDARYDEELDFPLGVIWNEDTGTWAHSVPATRAAEKAGWEMPTRNTLEEAIAFWSEREAPRMMPAAAARFPDLGMIETGTEIDHVLQGATDNPHVKGMVAAAQAAGVGFSRLHPDASYALQVTEVDRVYADYEADMAVAVDDLSLQMEPEDDEEVRGGDYLTAAALELLDRSRAQEWASNLDEPLFSN